MGGFGGNDSVRGVDSGVDRPKTAAVENLGKLVRNATGAAKVNATQAAAAMPTEAGGEGRNWCLLLSQGKRISMQVRMVL